METIYILLAAYSLLLVPAAFSIYDVYFQKWVRALPQSEEKDHYSQVFHAVKFWAMTLSVVTFLFWIYQALTFMAILDIHYLKILKWLPLAMTIYWFLFDWYWNRKNNMPWFYPGDGKGGFIEITVKTITVKLNQLFKWINSNIWKHFPKRPFGFAAMMFFSRLVVLMISVALIKWL